MGTIRSWAAMDRAGILSLARLMQFGDSMLPTGAFAFSGALESAVQKGAVHDAATLQQYVVSALRQCATGDAVGLDRALRRLCADPVSMGAPVSDAALSRLRTIDLALYRRKLPEEFRDMMTRTGRKLAELAASMTCSPLADRWMRQLRMGSSPGCYPVSLAVLFAASAFSQFPLRHAEGSEEGDAEVESLVQEALTTYFYGVAMGLLNAALRLMRVTHYDVQRIMYRSSELFPELCRRTAETPLDRMTGYAPMTDIFAAVHSQGRVRLFMS
ncbi:MAG: urease accessory protein UreF [Mailhella sp.]|nr:urease accessory protein UreF [Mailhella sp.]